MAQESPAVVYAMIAILMAIFSISLLVIPFEVLLGGAKTRVFVTAVANAVGETGTRLLFSLPCALLAYASFRQWRKGPG